MKLTNLFAIVLALPTVAFAQPCQKERTVVTHAISTAPGNELAQQDIVDVAVSAGDFKTLVAAVKAAELVDVLKGEGPFTVFAPNDAAFAKVPKEALSNLLKPENRKKLQKLLTYHVVPGKFTAAEISKVRGLKSAEGERIDVVTKDGNVMVDGAKVLKADIVASNGVIHVIDSVIMPADKDIVDTAASAETFSTLVAAVKAAGLVDTLKGEGPFTVFAPTDEAFGKLPKGTIEDLLKPANKAKLVAILTYHVVPGKVMSSDLDGIKSAKTVNGNALPIQIDNQKAMVGNATVTTADIETTNGVIHVIDNVLLPK